MFQNGPYAESRKSSRLMLAIVSLLFVSLPTAATGPGPAVRPVSPHPVSGRWDVTFELPEQQYRTIVELAVSDDGTVSATNLGYPLLQFTEASLKANELVLKGTSTYGPFVIHAAFEADRFSGRWQVAVLGGEVRGTRDTARHSAVSRLAVFESVWRTVDERFYDPHFNGVDWRRARMRYRPQAQAARTDGELVTVVRNMLGELKSSHLAFSALSLERSFVTATAQTGTAPSPIVWRTLAPTVGYIQIRQFDESSEAVASVDRAFAELGDLPALVLDVRGNPGGTLSAAMRVGDYLFPAERPVGSFVTRKGLARFKVASVEQIDRARLPVYSGYNVLEFRRELDRSGAVTIATGGRAKPYGGRVALLVDERCGSTTEGFASVVKETHAAILIGRRTAGAMLSSVEVPTTGGWTLRLPEADFRTPAGLRVEGTGVDPDIAVQKGGAGDPVLDRALSILQGVAPLRQPAFPQSPPRSLSVSLITFW